MDLTRLTISECSELLSRRQISPVELTEAHLERIQMVEPLLNCFITQTADLALDQARQAEIELQNGKRRSALHGIPLALKDLYETRNIRTTAGSLFFRDYIPTQDAYTVQRLYQSGAILLGKLNMHEIALGVTNVNPHYGACRNPWERTRSTGGSSGGSAAALAAGMCMGITRDGHGGLDPYPGLPVRRGGNEADLRQGQPARCDPVEPEPGPCRTRWRAACRMPQCFCR